MIVIPTAHIAQIEHSGGGDAVFHRDRRRLVGCGRAGLHLPDDPTRTGGGLCRRHTERKVQCEVGVDLRLGATTHRAVGSDQVAAVSHEHRHQRMRRSATRAELVRGRRLEAERRPPIVKQDPGRRVQDAGAECVESALDQRDPVAFGVGGDDGNGVTGTARVGPGLRGRRGCAFTEPEFGEGLGSVFAEQFGDRDGRVAGVSEETVAVGGGAGEDPGHDRGVLPDGVGDATQPASDDVECGQALEEEGALAVAPGAQADEGNERFFSNNARPSLIFSSDTPFDDAYERWRHSSSMKHTGTANAYKPLLIEGGKATPWMMNQQDLDFLESRKFSRDEIFVMFKVSPGMVGSVENVNRANLEAGFYTNAIINVVPCVRQFVRQLNSTFIKVYDPTLELDVERRRALDKIRGCRFALPTDV
ncbi:phage portal protein [Rhodococcus koreensis]|nr:phage portal protein [Rhodococcus koreensis]QSE84947.1 phage portal protein [Rhodococcus koreensis]